MRVLVTNDDGVESAGLRALASVAGGAGHEVVVAAPGWDSSGASASLTAVEHDGRVLFDERSYDDLPGVRVFAVEAAPAFIVRAAAVGGFGRPPEVVLSGINRGPNTGHAVLHSGTVGAAFTASTFGLRAMAVSIDSGSSPHWETAADLAELALDWLIAADAPVVLNVNVPNLPLSEVKGFQWARLAAFGAVQTTVTEAGAGYVKLAYNEVDADIDEGTDAAALRRGIACYTPLRPVCEAADVSDPRLGAMFWPAARSRSRQKPRRGRARAPSA